MVQQLLIKEMGASDLSHDESTKDLIIEAAAGIVVAAVCETKQGV
jgi:hypothetical protein